MAATWRLNVFAGAPSEVSIDHGRGPNGYLNTSCMLIYPPVMRYDDHPGKQVPVSLDDDITFSFGFL